MGTTSFRCFIFIECLSGKNAGSSDSLDLLFGTAGEESCFHDDWLVGESSLAQNLEVSSFDSIDDWGDVLSSFVGLSGLFADQRPQFVQVDCGACMRVLLVVEVTHTNLTKVTGMEFVEVDSVMMLTTSITTTTRVLTVFANTSMTVADVSS